MKCWRCSIRSVPRAFIPIVLIATLSTICPLVYSDLPGDVNRSGYVDAADIQAVINAVLGFPDPFICDLDLNGEKDASDIQFVTNTALGISVPDYGSSAPYDPEEPFALHDGEITFSLPPNALNVPARLHVRSIKDVELPVILGQKVPFVGADFGPDETNFEVPGTVTLYLEKPLPVIALPVVTYDIETDHWYGTGRLANVEGGLFVEFPVDHFSWAGVPGFVSVPGSGQSIPNTVNVESGVFQSNIFSVDGVYISYSKTSHYFYFGASEAIGTGLSKLENGPQSLWLAAFDTDEVDGYITGKIGGGSQFFDGRFSENVVGTIIMGKSKDTYSITFFVASNKRVITGSATSGSEEWIAMPMDAARLRTEVHGGS
jgi:hypothetical protein